MFAIELVSDVIPALKTSDTGQEALNWMEVFRISHLPIVNNQDFLGIISDTDIYDLNKPEEAIGNHKLSLFRAFALTGQHLFEVLGIAARNKLTIVPVLDENNHYKGVVTTSELVKRVASLSSLDQPGGIIVLELSERDYSLSQIAQIVESNDIRVLSLYLSKKEDSVNMEVTLKLNTTDITSLVKTFERYNYSVKSWATEDDGLDKFYSDRLDLLFRYLNT